jgi:hypothetical protein
VYDAQCFIVAQVHFGEPARTVCKHLASTSHEDRLDEVGVLGAGCRVTSVSATVISAWGEAVRVARIRADFRARALDTSIRAVARVAGCSHGRAGELLRIHAAFSRGDLIILGRGDRGDGESRLSRLSYRQFRQLLTIDSSWSRVMAVREMDGDHRWTE